MTIISPLRLANKLNALIVNDELNGREKLIRVIRICCHYELLSSFIIGFRQNPDD